MKKLFLILFIVFSAFKGNAQITVSPSNFVGINNTNPSDLLDVIGNPVFGTSTERLSLGSGALGFNRRVATGTIYNASSYAYQFNHTGSSTQANDYLAFQVYQPGGTQVTPAALSINGLGNVGIGTTTTYDMLTVNGNMQLSNASIPMGLITEFPGTSTPSLNFDINFREHNKNIGFLGASFRIYSNIPNVGPLFQWLYRPSESTTEYTLMTLNNNGQVGLNIGTATPAYTLDLSSTGQIRAAKFITASDSTLKTNIQNLSGVMPLLLKLQGVTYKFKSNVNTLQNPFVDTSFINRTQIGFLAQDVQKVFKQLVYTDNKGLMSLDYQGIVPVLVEAFKEQNTVITNLQTTNTSLQTSVTNLQTSNSNLQASVNSLQALVTSLQASVSALQKKVSSL